MPKQHPRFLFSNPLATKTPGPFIIHLLNPKLLFKIEQKALVIVPWGEYNDPKAAAVKSAAEEWLFYQVKEKLIDL